MMSDEEIRVALNERREWLLAFSKALITAEARLEALTTRLAQVRAELEAFGLVLKRE